MSVFLPGRDPLNGGGLRTAQVGPEPLVTRNDDHSVNVTWPGGRARSVEVTTELVEQVAEQWNTLVVELATWRKRAEERRIAHRDLYVRQDRLHDALERIVQHPQRTPYAVQEMQKVAREALNPPAAEPSRSEVARAWCNGDPCPQRGEPLTVEQAADLARRNSAEIQRRRSEKYAAEGWTDDHEDDDRPASELSDSELRARTLRRGNEVVDMLTEMGADTGEQRQEPDEPDGPRIGDAEDARRDPDPDDAPRGWEP